MKFKNVISVSLVSQKLEIECSVYGNFVYFEETLQNASFIYFEWEMIQCLQTLRNCHFSGDGYLCSDLRAWSLEMCAMHRYLQFGEDKLFISWDVNLRTNAISGYDSFNHVFTKKGKRKTICNNLAMVGAVFAFLILCILTFVLNSFS